MRAGDLFRVPLGDGRFGAGRVLGVDGDVVAVALCGAVWDCAPGPLDVQQTSVAVAHLPVRAGAAAEAEVVGHEAPAAPEGDYAAWLAGAERPVVDAPLAVLVGALIDL
jgi:hypothetical protein